MMYHITALTNDRAKLIVNETRTTDLDIANIVEENLKRRGYIVVRRQES